MFARSSRSERSKVRAPVMYCKWSHEWKWSCCHTYFCQAQKVFWCNLYVFFLCPSAKPDLRHADKYSYQIFYLMPLITFLKMTVELIFKITPRFVFHMRCWISFCLCKIATDLFIFSAVERIICLLIGWQPEQCHRVTLVFPEIDLLRISKVFEAPNWP